MKDQPSHWKYDIASNLHTLNNKRSVLIRVSMDTFVQLDSQVITPTCMCIFFIVGQVSHHTLAH